jgi:hypothetical protein
MKRAKKHTYLKNLYSSIKRGDMTLDDLTEEQKDIIFSSPSWGYRFCRSIFKERSPKLEETLLHFESIKYAYLYSRFVIEGRFIEAESLIGKDPKKALKYAIHVKKDRFPEGEPSILKTPIERFGSPRELYISFLEGLK